MDSVKERLKAFIEYKKISIRSFENRCGLSYGYVNNMRVSIQPAKLKSISLQFPDLNKSWLLTGEGEMLVPTEGKTVIMVVYLSLRESFLFRLKFGMLLKSRQTV